MADIGDLPKSLESRGILRSPWKLIQPYEKNNTKSIEPGSCIRNRHESINRKERGTYVEEA